MKAIVVPECLFREAFSRAEYDLNKAIHDAQDEPLETARVALALANLQAALHRLRDRLIQTQL